MKRESVSPRGVRLAASLIGLGTALAAGTGQAQVFTEPLVPVPAVPVAPSVPPPSGYLPLGFSVTDRPRPEYDPLGLRSGDFTFFPRFEVDEAYNDNVFATTHGKSSAFITVLQPSFDIRSSLPTNALNVSAGASFFRYSKHSSLNSDNGFGDVNGRLDVDNTHFFTGDARAERSHIDLGAPQVPGNAAAPLVFNDYNGTVGFEQYRLRIGYELTGTVRREEYQALPLVGGGFAPQSNLNNLSYEGVGRVYYEFQPGYQGYLRGSYNKRDYDHAAGNGIPILSSKGYRVNVGAKINLTGVTSLEGFVGYLSQTYDAAALGSISGIDFGANVVWNVTELTSVNLKAGRTVQDVNNVALGGIAALNSPGYLETAASLGVDHELLRNLLLNASLNYAHDDFQNITRVDNIYGATAGAKYLLNRNLYLGGSYTYQRLRSSGQGSMAPFSRNIFLVRLSTQL